MNGILISFTRAPEAPHEPKFWQIFKAIRPQLDALFWCLPAQPWMGAPPGFYESDCTVALPNRNVNVTTTVQLWRHGALGAYANSFGEEYFELWAIPHDVQDKVGLVAQYEKVFDRPSGDQFIAQHAQFWIIYTDSSCWEFFSRSSAIVESLRKSLNGKRGITTYESQADGRGQAFGMAGLSHMWQEVYRVR